MKAARRNSRIVRIVRIAYFGALCSMFAATALAQPPAKAPDVPAPLVTKVFKAQAELANAQLTAERASQGVQDKTQAMQRVLAELQQACGEKFEPQLSSAGDPVCVAKTAVAKK